MELRVEIAENFHWRVLSRVPFSRLYFEGSEQSLA